jgi:hypothetical protein
MTATRRPSSARATGLEVAQKINVIISYLYLHCPDTITTYRKVYAAVERETVR